MWWVVFFSSICLLLTYLQDIRHAKRGMLIGFILMTVFLSLRYNYGNDYQSYVTIFQNANSSNWRDLTSMTQYVELVWLALCKLFNPLGFQWLIAFHTAFVFFSVYYIIKKYVPRGWWWLAVFFFLFNSNILVTYISMLRQAMAICCFLLAVDAAFDKKIIFTVLFSTIAITVHTSGLVILPFVLFALITSYISSSKKMIIYLSVLSAFSLVLMIFDSSIAERLLSSTMSNFSIFEDKYEGFTTGAKMGTGLGLFGNMIAFIPCVLYIKKFTNIELFFILLFFINIVLFPMEYVISMFARIRFYYIAFGIIALPLLMNRTKDRTLRNVIMVIVIFINIWNYYLFFTSTTFIHAYSEYHWCF